MLQKKVSSKVTRHTITQMAIEDGEEAKFMVLFTLILSYMAMSWPDFPSTKWNPCVTLLLDSLLRPLQVSVDDE
jgi:hypothetical protein